MSENKVSCIRVPTFVLRVQPVPLVTKAKDTCRRDGWMQSGGQRFRCAHRNCCDRRSCHYSGSQFFHVSSSSIWASMRDGPEAGLTHFDAVLEHGELANYYLAHSARADMYRRLGRTAEARSSYEKALALTLQEPERQFLQGRIRQLK